MKYSEKEYKEFSEILAKSKYELIGVRLPIIRKIASRCSKNILKDNLDFKLLLDEFYKYITTNCISTNKSCVKFEEVMLYGIMVVTSPLSDNIKIDYIRDFVYLIKDWSVCDSVCASIKVESKGILYEFAKNLSNCDDEFILRFMIVIFMRYFMEEEYLDDIIKIIGSINVEFYYTNMAIAWWLSDLYVYSKDRYMNIVNEKQFNGYIINLSIRKIIDSYRVSREEKECIKKLKQTERF